VEDDVTLHEGYLYVTLCPS